MLLRALLADSDEILQQAENGVRQYAEVLRLYACCDRSPEAFLKAFRALYKLRWPVQHGKPFLTVVRRTSIVCDRSLSDVMYSFRRFRKRWEFSFATKLIHTVDNTRPIWDANVARQLEAWLGSPGPRPAQPMRWYEARYAALGSAFEELLKHEEWPELCAAFDRKLGYRPRISEAKKLDFYLWARTKRRRS